MSFSYRIHTTALLSEDGHPTPTYGLCVCDRVGQTVETVTDITADPREIGLLCSLLDGEDVAGEQLFYVIADFLDR